MCGRYSVGYHNLPLIQKINLHVNRGEILTLIGPNGAGKSTILKSLIGQLKLVKGAVWLDGTSMGTMKEKEIALRMSVMMTGRVKTERMTCEEVVSMGRYPYTGKMGILDRKRLADRKGVFRTGPGTGTWQKRT